MYFTMVISFLSTMYLCGLKLEDINSYIKKIKLSKNTFKYYRTLKHVAIGIFLIFQYYLFSFSTWGIIEIIQNMAKFSKNSSIALNSSLNHLYCLIDTNSINSSLTSNFSSVNPTTLSLSKSWEFLDMLQPQNNILVVILVIYISFITYIWISKSQISSESIFYSNYCSFMGVLFVMMAPSIFLMVTLSPEEVILMGVSILMIFLLSVPVLYRKKVYKNYKETEMLINYYKNEKYDINSALDPLLFISVIFSVSNFFLAGINKGFGLTTIIWVILILTYSFMLISYYNKDLQLSKKDITMNIYENGRYTKYKDVIVLDGGLESKTCVILTEFNEVISLNSSQIIKIKNK